MSEKELILACRKKNKRAQKALFDRYSPKMTGVARRYVGGSETAEDIIVKAFYKVLTKLEMYNEEGSFEGWIRRIVVNEALMFLRKSKKHKYQEEINPEIDLPIEPKAEQKLAADDILELMNAMPEGYRTIFNLYVIEGYKHREIAELLDISINTSKSQLILAKKKMKKLLAKIGIHESQ